MERSLEIIWCSPRRFSSVFVAVMTIFFRNFEALGMRLRGSEGRILL